MPPKRPSGSFAVAETPMSEQRIEELAAIVRGVMAEQKPRTGWQWWAAIILSPILGAASFFVTQQMAFQKVEDKVEQHETAIAEIKQHEKDSDMRADATRLRIEDKLDRLSQLMSDRSKR